MTREEIIEDLTGIVSEIADVDPSEVTDEKSFVIDLDVDSLLMVEIVVALERHFKVTLPKKELADIELVSDMVTHIEKRLAV